MTKQSIEWWRKKIIPKCPSVYAFHLTFSPSYIAENAEHLSIDDSSLAFILNGELFLDLAHEKDIPTFLNHFKTKTKTVFVQDKKLTETTRTFLNDFHESSFTRTCYLANLSLWQQENYPERILRNIRKSKQQITDTIWRCATLDDLQQFWVEYKLYSLDKRFKIPSKHIVEKLWQDWGVFNELYYFEIKFHDENETKTRKHLYFSSKNFASYLFGWGDKHSKVALDSFMFDFAANKFKLQNIDKLDLGLLPDQNDGINNFKLSFPGNKQKHVLTTFKKI